MRIAIDIEPLSGGHSFRGIGEMVRGQIGHLKEESDRNRDFTIDAINFEKSDLSEYDVVHYPYFFPYDLTLPSKKVGVKTIVMIQDLIQLVFPKNYPPGIRGSLNLIKQKQRLKSVDLIITISETSKKDIVRFLGVDPKKVEVVYLAPREIFKVVAKNSGAFSRVKKKYKLPKDFVLYVGDVNFNKNISTLIEACKIAQVELVIVGKQALDIEEQGMDIKSIRGPRDWIRFLIGKPHPELAHYDRLLEEFNNNKHVKRLGFVSDDELVAIYNLASVYCQPSLYEGFGLPVLEAMACGVPVVVSKTNALVEVAGDAALVADPSSPHDFGKKIKKAMSDPSIHKKLTKKGLKRAKEFTWEKTAEQTLEVYKKFKSD